jgi:hypothetical protein
MDQSPSEMMIQRKSLEKAQSELLKLLIQLREGGESVVFELKQF